MRGGGHFCIRAPLACWAAVIEPEVIDIGPGQANGSVRGLQCRRDRERLERPRGATRLLLVVDGAPPRLPLDKLGKRIECPMTSPGTGVRLSLPGSGAKDWALRGA